jgi:Flp pilus assembly pilin Flp
MPMKQFRCSKPHRRRRAAGQSLTEYALLLALVALAAVLLLSSLGRSVNNKVQPANTALGGQNAGGGIINWPNPDETRNQDQVSGIVSNGPPSGARRSPPRNR